MIEYLEKDVTTVDMGIIAHGVNCQGAMGSGVAGAIRAKWPIVYEKFRLQPTGAAVLGTCHMIPIKDNDSLWVANCYTQLFYGYGGKFADSDSIEKSMSQCAMYAEIFDLPIFMPPIGCGLGGLTWDADVKPRIEKIAEQYDRVTIYVCDLPQGK